MVRYDAQEFSELIARNLVDRVTISYFDRLLEIQGRVDKALESVRHNIEHQSTQSNFLRHILKLCLS